MRLSLALCVAVASITSIPAFANPNVQPMFTMLTTPSNWTWQTFNTLANTTAKGGLKKDQNVANRFYLERAITGYTNATITAYGDKSAPNEVVFYSGGWRTTSDKGLLKLSDVVNTAELTQVKSNCNFGKIEDKYTGKDTLGKAFKGVNYIESQTIYKWSKGTAKPLYVVAMRGGGSMQTSVLNQGMNSTVIVVPNVKDLNGAIALHGWNKEKNGKKVTCKVG
ncbi:MULTISPECIES: hypothetical protein [unclassified Moraxella]|uniref:hypothetical protein n=1 Tax=unclassified Moraxella TaxID=2685852 RepID=UPI003AF83BB2